MSGCIIIFAFIVWLHTYWFPLQSKGVPYFTCIALLKPLLHTSSLSPMGFEVSSCKCNLLCAMIWTIFTLRRCGYLDRSDFGTVITLKKKCNDLVLKGLNLDSFVFEMVR